MVFFGGDVLTFPGLSEGGRYARLLFLVFPIVAATTLVALLRLRHSLRDMIVISLTSTLLTLYTIEIGIRWLGSDTVDEFQGSRAHVQQVNPLREEGLKATLNITPKHLVGGNKPKINGDEVLPVRRSCELGGRPVQRDQEVVYHENDENGFTNPSGVYDKDSLKVVVIGDSFAYGFCIEPDNTIVGVVRQAYPDTLNLGMSGSGPVIERAGIVEYPSQHRPRVMLWMYYEGNSLEDLVKEESRQATAQVFRGFRFHPRFSKTQRPSSGTASKSCREGGREQAYQSRSRTSQFERQSLVI